VCSSDLLAVGTAGERDRGAERNRTRKHESVIIVGMFPDQIDPSGCMDNDVGLTAELRSKALTDALDKDWIDVHER